MPRFEAIRCGGRTSTLFGAIQVFAAAPTAAVPEVHYFYAATNVIIGAAAAMSM